MNKIVTFGELMLRLAPNGYLRFVQSEQLEATFGGAEANVAVSLSNYGLDAAFVFKLPSHEIGQMAVNSLRKFGVNVSDVVRGGERVGIYYCEKGASQRPSIRLHQSHRGRYVSRPSIQAQPQAGASPWVESGELSLHAHHKQCMAPIP